MYCPRSWTKPQLDEFALAIRTDKALKSAIGALKDKFLHYTQALIHGDLHTGSMMVTENTTYMIDPEFAYYGPMGFDVGAVLANLLLAYYSQRGHSNGEEYGEWILQQIVAIWESFHAKFLALWTEENLQGEAIKLPIYGDMLVETKEEYMRKLFLDSCGFTGAKMLRRIVGIAHVEDLKSIADDDVRADCEKRALLLARWLMVQSQASAVQDIAAVVAKAREYNTTADLAWPAAAASDAALVV